MSNTSGLGPCLGAFVPGLPHLLRGDLNPRYKDLAKAVAGVGDSFAAEGVSRIIYFSTKWLSVLGQMYQGRPRLSGCHVDEMWYDFGDLSFDFTIDTDFAQLLSRTAREHDYQTQIVNYEGFPVDTGTIVADLLLNRGRFRVNMVACSLYLDFKGMQDFARTVRQAVAMDGEKTAIVAVSGLSGQWLRRFVDDADDQTIDPSDDVYNRNVLSLLEEGDVVQGARRLVEGAGLHHLDMGGKGFSFLMGAGVMTQGRPAHVKAYGSIYGTGAAVIYFPA